MIQPQVPASVDRSVAVAALGRGDPEHPEGGLTLPLTDDPGSRRALSVAQATVAGLRERLAQKEETVARYEQLLRRAREEHEDELRRRQRDLAALQITVRNQTQAFNELKSASNAATLVTPASAAPASSVIAQQSERINILEEEVQELQASLAELSNQLAAARFVHTYMHTYISSS